jgi:hypothetical protein
MRSRLAILTSLALASAAPVAVAQNAPKSKPPASRPPAPAQPAPRPAAPEGAVPKADLSDEIFRLNSVGLEMRLPLGSTAQTNGGGDKFSSQVMAKDSTWLINIQTPSSTDRKRSLEAIAKEVRDQLLASVAVVDSKRTGTDPGKTRGRVVEDVAPVSISDAKSDETRPGVRFYVRLPRGEKDPAVVRGYTIFQIAPGRFVAFDLATTEPNFAAARAAYESSIATARFEDTAAAAASRGKSVEAGVALLNSLTEADYNAAVGLMKDQWFRLSKPAASGVDSEAQEVAYRRVRAWKGKRGEIDPQREAKNWTVEDNQPGYLVRIDARYLRDKQIVDSVGIYFMTADRKEEAWLLQMVIRDPGQRKPATWREVGARNGTSMQVSTDGSSESKAAQPTVPDQGYVNQVEAFLLPQLLFRSANHPEKAGQYGFYSYQSEFGNIRLRRDTVAAATDGVGAWTIVTKMNEDRPPQTSTYTDRGELVRTNLQDGTAWTATTLQKLADQWRAKNLPWN